ncbi:hypothetical protein LRM40_02455 [Ideonella dechloratans]|uniref:hypothetical protein n=1 Tax=Ideonella dechloratans TaxID=36863 RepID=UPI0014782E67|nr:hypothetical protein [Ideonella dechloratans]UFU10590.1 hypothetical protein LRM40_02455 [Ideonella dechloratans]
MNHLKGFDLFAMSAPKTVEDRILVLQEVLAELDFVYEQIQALSLDAPQPKAQCAS